jgi:hypothetical protein
MNRDYTPHACVTIAGMVICMTIVQWRELRSAYGTFGQLDRPVPSPVIQRVMR